MTHAITTYLNTLKQNLQAGMATEHTHRSTLETLIGELQAGVKAINEPKRIACGAPDLAILKDTLMVGHIEAKDVGADLNAVERSPQLQRYRGALPNLILTDYLAFRWYVEGDLRRTATLGRWDGSKLRVEKEGSREVTQLLTDFLAHTPQPIATPRELAERMARLAHLIREIILTAFETGRASSLLENWRKAFAEVLVADLDQPEKTGEFADMFAQTLAYGLFSARVMDETPQTFTRAKAQRLIPRTNPFLRRFFYEITGPDLEDEPYGGFVEDLVQLLAQADMGAILEDFGKRTRQQDPTVHFYETFLAAYDPRLREARGVYYTPDPVVSFIVRSVDELIKSRFGLPQGLADTSKVTIKNSDPGLRVKGKESQVRKTREVHKVLILDPATGTATFPYAIIDHIRAHFMEQGNGGMWSSYVREHLLPRIFGFELLMAPYAVAHFKLALQLAGHDLPEGQRHRWAYDFGTDERIGIYLTNALEGPHEHTGLPIFTQFLADESAAANEIKQDTPIMVVVGNPPYSVSSSNRGPHIEKLMELYKTAVRSERNIQPLSDDYIKFIRFAHDRIERTGYGILGFITNHSYLSGLIHRGMREELLKSFDEIYILNLHGNALLGETTPDGSKDENVFDIRQGVAIALMVKTGKGDGLATVHYADLWGERENKYHVLSENDIVTLDWKALQPVAPYYFFLPKDFNLTEEYSNGESVEIIFPTHSSGMNTLHDGFVINFDYPYLVQMLQDATDPTITDKDFRDQYQVRDSRDWKLSDCRKKAQQTGLNEYKTAITKCIYRPFDYRWIVLHDDFVGYARWETTYHFLQLSNIGFVTAKQSLETISCLVSNIPLGQHKIVDTYHRSYVFPLYLYPTQKADTLFAPTDLSPWPPDPNHDGRVPNLSPAFVEAMEKKLGIGFQACLPPSVPPQVGGRKIEQETVGGSERGEESKREGVKGREREEVEGSERGEREGREREETGGSGREEEEGCGSERGEGEERRYGVKRTTPELWARLKPLARQMRHEPTRAEDTLWQRLRNRKLANTKFRRQHVIERFIVDFYAAEPRLVIEVDGPIHDYTQEQDALRQAYLESLDLHVLRFTNEQVLRDMDNVLATIAAHLTPAPLPSQVEDASSNVSSIDPFPPQVGGLRGVNEPFTPQDILAYIYAIFHSPTYRDRYAEFLKIDFPRVPLTSDLNLFWELVTLGRQLIALHLLESPQVDHAVTHYPMPGDNQVAKGYPRYVPPGAKVGKDAAPLEQGRVYINAQQYLEGVAPEIWDFQIGGYQVLDKWLKDRRGRTLTYDDLAHYQRIVVALQQTLRLMEQIDTTIEDHGGWPIT